MYAPIDHKLATSKEMQNGDHRAAVFRMVRTFDKGSKIERVCENRRVSNFVENLPRKSFFTNDELYIILKQS